MNFLLGLLTEAEFVPDPARVTAGWIGGFFFFGMFGLVFLLWWNMNGRIKRMNQQGFVGEETNSVEPTDKS